MVHTGTERSSEVACPPCSDPSRLLPALEEGCTVIAAHAGMGNPFDKKEDYEHFFPNLVDLVGRFPNLFCDTAVLASMLRWRSLPSILEESAVVERLVHASDWPFPSNAMVFWNRLRPNQMLNLCAETNLFERDYQLKRALGLPIEVFDRGARLLSQSRSTGHEESGTQTAAHLQTRNAT